METAEASGKTVDDALNRALAKLGARREDVEFVVLDEGRKGGLFGRGAKDAMVRVERVAGGGQASASEGEVPDTRIPRGRPGGGDRERGGDRGGDRGAARGARPQRAGAGAGSGGGRPRDGGMGGGQRSTRTGFDAPAPKLTEDDFLRPRPPAGAPAGEEPPMATEGERPSRPPRPRREGGGDRLDRPARPPRQDGGQREQRGERRRDDGPPVEPDINAEEVDFAAHIVDDVLRLLDINADITIREPLTAGDGLGDVRAVIDIGGDGLGLLIGRRGDTLTAFQYLVNLIVTRRFPEKGGVTIDVEHYRHRREEQVMTMANRMADRVRQTGSPITLEPMSPSERRLVHMALAEDTELETNSIGEGENRKVVISQRG